MASATKSKLEDLNVTKDELKKIGDALKDENFRKLFLEYAHEISDPKNRRLYEEEIRQMENERGMDVQFIYPQPGHVLETSIDGKTKAFINIAQNEKIDKPSSKRETDKTGKTGVMWQIPHSFAQPREDVENGEKCEVFDVVFHPDTYRMSETNEGFLKLVHDTAIDGIEKQFDVKVDRKNLKKCKMTFKGVAQASVIRSKNENPTSSKTTEDDDILKQMPYPYDNQTTAEKMKAREATIQKRENEKRKKDSKTTQLKAKDNTSTEAAVPEYTITHRSNLDLQEYRNAPDAHTSTRPKDLVIKIYLPLLPSASHAALDIFEQRLKLECKEPAAYKLDIKLPYPVNDDEGSAKFDKTKKCLTVTVPVLPAETPKLPSFIDDEKRTNGDTHDLTDNSENENMEHEPKIVELSSTDNTTEDLSESPLTTPVPEKSQTQPKFVYTLPDYTYNQDAETLSFIFNVKNISESTITKSFLDCNGMRISFVSLGSGGFPMHYSLVIAFDEDCKLATEHCTTDLSEINLVLVMLKDKSCRGLWDKFQAGLDEDHLEEKLLLTDISLQKQLDELDIEAEEGNQEGKQLPSTLQSRTSRMKNKKLSINLQADPALLDEDEEYDPPSSADIEVIHKKAPPQLHSILKQRTVSESSDDHTGSGAESPRSCGDDTPSPDSESKTPSPDSESKKSVTFNQYVDSATYKKNMAPSSMTSALKSKRRRARKKEEKMANRRRRKSSGSEGSSGDETTPQTSHSNPDNKKDKKKAKGESVRFEQIAEDEEEEKNEKKTERDESVVPSLAGEGSELVGKDNQDFRTNSSVDGSEKKREMVEVIKAKMAATDVVHSSDSDDEDDFVVLDERTSMCDESGADLVYDASIKQAACDESNASSTEHYMANGTDDQIEEPVSEARDEDDVQVQQNGVNEKAGKVEGTNKGDNSSENANIETELSWEDATVGSQALSDQFTTKCAFTFSNTLMYELDNDV